MKPKMRDLFIATLIFTVSSGAAQPFTHQDTLRGSVTPGRAWWDLGYYHLYMKVNIPDSTISGTNTVTYKVLEPSRVMQIDLQFPMQIDKVVWKGKELSFRRDGNAWLIEFPDAAVTGSVDQMVIAFSGKPHVAELPPWRSGFTWATDSKGRPFIGTSCQGDGASLWWPCKDHQYDEPDSMLISIEVPRTLTAVSNGRLRKVEENRRDKTKTFNWFVSNPINNYGVTLNVADYVQYGEKYMGEKGELDCTYYVLRENEAKAREQFKDVPRTLKAFEHWLGPYPFYKDGYKLVEAPFLGMEHQSAVAYGNEYGNGYRGLDLSRSSWGLKFDYIIVHESAHEWFGNSITSRDVADMWVHEAFAAYAEDLFVDFYYGKQAASDYIQGTRSGLQNDIPIIGVYDVNREGSSDMYFKGANMLHTLRQIIHDDTQWREILRGLNATFYHKIVTSADVENYFNEHIKIDLTTFFDQYLRDTRIPIFEYRLLDGRLEYRWSNCVAGFNMPLRVWVNETEVWLAPRTDWRVLDQVDAAARFTVDPDFYVATFNLTAPGH